MGRAIDQENRIDEVNVRLNELTQHVIFLQETVTKLVELAQGEPDEPKKKTTKKKTKSSDGTKDSISNK